MRHQSAVMVGRLELGAMDEDVRIGWCEAKKIREIEKRGGGDNNLL